MTMANKVKRKNHYVWAHYLKAWANNGQDVYYRSPKRNIACGSVKGLAREDGFYRMTPLTANDFQLVKTWIEQFELPLQQIHFDLLQSMMIRSMQINALCPVEKKAERDALLFNTIEDIHTRVELDMRPAINLIRAGDLNALDDEAIRNNFISYMGHQFTRTLFARNIWSSPVFREKAPVAELVERNWWLLSIIFGVNAGYGIERLYAAGKLVWLRNQTNIPFVTSDNPVINVHPEVLDRRTIDTPPKEVDFYFPLTPTLAFMVSESGFYGSGEVEAREEHVSILNRNMLLMSSQTIFGSTHEIIATTKLRKD